MKSLFAFLVPLLCLLPGGCITPKSSTTAPVITGRAVNVSACRPVAGFLLEVCDRRLPWWTHFILCDGFEPRKIGTTTTDSNGRYCISVSGKGSKNDYEIRFGEPISSSFGSRLDLIRFINESATPKGNSTLITGQVIDISTEAPFSGKVVKIYDTWDCPLLHHKSPRLIGTTVTGTYGKFRLDVPHRFNDNYVSAEVTVNPEKQSSWRVIDMMIYQNRFFYYGTLDDGLKYDVNSKSQYP